MMVVAANDAARALEEAAVSEADPSSNEESGDGSTSDTQDLLSRQASLAAPRQPRCCLISALVGVGTLAAVLVALVCTGSWRRAWSAGDVDSPRVDADLSSMQDSYYMQLDPQKSIEANAASAFEHFINASKLDKEMSDVEVRSFEERFVAELGGQASDDARAWRKREAVALEETKPIATDQLVHEINRAPGEWHARIPSWLANLSDGGLKDLFGYLDDDEDDDADRAQRPTLPVLRLQGPLPLEFDSRKHWPLCSGVFSHVRNQGSCGSCWANAAAGTIDGRLCIRTSGRFSGENAWTSAGYIAMCYHNRQRNGCGGGSPGRALEAVGKYGVPTGSFSADTCVPYFGSGNPLKHFLRGGMTAPPCPTTCTTEAQYPRTLEQDKFYFAPGFVIPTTIVNDAKRSMLEGGPLPMSFTVYKDFMVYGGGYYSVRLPEVVGKHAATTIGWTSYLGKDYLSAVNSWGQDWGEMGLFKMLAGCCNNMYHVPTGEVNPSQSALPIPPSRRRRASCEDHPGGTCVMTACDSSRGVGVWCPHGRCKCKAGYCSENGRCVRSHDCIDDTGGTCKFFGCGAIRGATYCDHGKCKCDLGLCAKNGRCS
eukprot:TRINITY_DN27052_c0_g4_i1.p1 TRINITY_DN27052_c0_g4~~TRINITY_DN27052_c0_g4_i1.p1  ORF type:complete len:597 (+),score=123.34 TRINITY_DN27052_c0_g4_i1:64-1854(+)